MAIQTEKRNTLARLDTALAQRARETAHANRKLRISEALISTNDSSMIRILLFGVPWKSYGRKWNVHDVFHCLAELSPGVTEFGLRCSHAGRNTHRPA